MPEDNYCPVCGKHFAEEEDYENHAEMDHPEIKELYGEAFSKEQNNNCPICTPEKWNSATNEERKSALDAHDAFLAPDYLDNDWEFLPQEVKTDLSKKSHAEPASEINWDEIPEDELDNVVIRKAEDKDKEADELEKHEEKPIQSHDEWTKELDQLRDQYSGKEAHHFELPDQSFVTNLTQKDEEDDEEEAEEDGGADDPLQKVADLAESYRYMSRDKRSQLFETLGFGQRDSAVLSGLEWNELTRPVKVVASEAYKKSQEQEEEETGEDPDEKEENEIYENFYNLEKYHDSPDFKKKLTCTRCNEAFNNKVDRDIHFNDVHAQEQSFDLSEECPLCGDIIEEPETLDWHMQQEHGAHVPSQYTQTGIKGAMADTDWDRIEYAGASRAGETTVTCPECGEHTDDLRSHLQSEHGYSEAGVDRMEEVRANEGMPELISDLMGDPVYHQGRNRNEAWAEYKEKEAQAGWAGANTGADFDRWLAGESKANEDTDRPVVQGDPVEIVGRECFDWEGYEIDCDTGERIGQGYSQSKAYQQFLNENNKAIERDIGMTNADMIAQGWDIMAEQEYGKKKEDLTDEEYRNIAEMMNEYVEPNEPNRWR